MNLKDTFTAYLKASDVREEPLTLTIRGIRKPDADDSRRRPVAVFEENSWALPLNQSNLKTIAEAFGWETDDWTGVVIEAHYDPSVEYNGRRMGGVRLRIPKGRKIRRKVTPMALEMQIVAGDF